MFSTPRSKLGAKYVSALLDTNLYVKHKAKAKIIGQEHVTLRGAYDQIIHFDKSFFLLSMAIERLLRPSTGRITMNRFHLIN